MTPTRRPARGHSIPSTISWTTYTLTTTSPGGTSPTSPWANIDQAAASVDSFPCLSSSQANNPTVNDVWNSTPAWGYPYLASELAPSPGAMTLIEGTFAQQVIGLNPYIYWNRLVYAEVGGYGTLSPRTNTTLGIE